MTSRRKKGLGSFRKSGDKWQWVFRKDGITVTATDSTKALAMAKGLLRIGNFGAMPIRPRQAFESLSLLKECCTVSESGCWEWQFVRNYCGYGQIAKNGKTVSAHRIAWEHVNGPIPDGLWALHRCDNPPCCNPDHLFLGTAQDNQADRIAKGRLRTGQRANRGKGTHSRRTGNHLMKEAMKQSNAAPDAIGALAGHPVKEGEGL